jgi:hypothetical protein
MIDKALGLIALSMRQIVLIYPMHPGLYRPAGWGSVYKSGEEFARGAA